MKSYQEMSIKERKDVERSVKKGEAYQKWYQQQMRKRIKFIIITVLFFVMMALPSLVIRINMILFYVAISLFISYVLIVGIYLLIDSRQEKLRPQIWECPSCHHYLPCRKGRYGKDVESYIPDTYIIECPHCHYDIRQ